jgi:hypothetical protein
MFWPQLSRAALAFGLVSASGAVAFAQTATPGPQTTATLLASVSAQAGIPYNPVPRPGSGTAGLPGADAPGESRLCVRAGLGLSLPAISGPQMTVESGLFGCPTNTGGLPIILLQDPALQPPPTSRPGDYNLDLTVRYRLLRMKQMQVVASASDQGVGYSLNSPVSGNNLLLAMSLIF